MLIDKKKWNESFISDKINFVQSTFYIANVSSDCVSKDDLIVMCDFLLKYVHDLKSTNREQELVINKLTEE